MVRLVTAGKMWILSLQNQQKKMRSIISLGLLMLMAIACQNKPKETVMPQEPEPIDTDKIDYIMGQFEPDQHDDFVLIPSHYASRKGMYLRKEAFEDYLKMYEHASSDGIKFTIRSATRNFEYQRGIWERKWTGETILSDGTAASNVEDFVSRAKKILLFSSMPSTSRHHWGTDIDLNSFDNAYFESGQGLQEYNWLLEHAATYGFCQPYTDKSGGRTGYEEEKWHWTYMPISKDLTEYAASYLSDDMITGFLGSEVAAEIGVVKNYVLGINGQCGH
jgi:LAS superfamily LD-carboxypeptidase LdcB